jgi:integrase
MSDRPGQLGDYWLSKREGSDAWCRTWYDTRARQTKRASLGTGDFQAAQIKLAEWFVREGRVSKQDPQDVPIEQVFVRYWHRRGSSLASKETTQIALGLWSEFFAGRTVSEVTPDEQRKFARWLASGGKRGKRSTGYVKRILGVGAAALNDAHREGEILAVPYILPGEDAPPKDLVLTVAQSAALWNAATLPHERRFLVLAYATLARPEAILELHKGFADLSRGLLAINPPGRKQTKKFRPTIPISAELRPWLDGAPDGPLVTYHGEPIKSFKTAWRRMRRDAKLPTDAVPKTIRHTMATELRAAGVPEAEIQGFLGHRAYGGKTEVYAKYRPEYLGHAVSAIDGYIARVRASCVRIGEGT